ncbi:MAG TPA: nuclear transport factor 2 family protein [Alphaproteobacteria bacterium]|jgi:hypothetical protein
MSRDEEELLLANEAFYAAFARGDAAAMEDLWAQEHPVACLHPGWPPLKSRDQVLQSWRGILANPPRPAIVVLEPRAFLLDGAGAVICWEAIGDVHLVASNLFVREQGRWRMALHQSGQTEHAPKVDATTATPTSTRLH